MRINTAEIEGYDSMTAEEKVAALEGLDVKDTETEQHYKELVSKANSEAKKYKDAARASEDKLKAKMTDEERAKQEHDDRIKELETENASLKRDKDVLHKTNHYKSLGFSDELAKETAEAFVDGNFDQVEKNQLKAHADFEKAVREEVARNNPQPENAGGSSGKKMSLAEAMQRANAGEQIDISQIN